MKPMVDMGVYEFKDLETGKITPEKSLINDYTEEVHELDQTRTSTKRLHIMLDAQYENPD